MGKTIELQLKSAYGETRAYPINSAARMFCELGQTKTFTPLMKVIAERNQYIIVENI